jgi:hypothetical protein
MNKKLNIYRINILSEVTTNNYVRNVGEFYFQISKGDSLKVVKNEKSSI